MDKQNHKMSWMIDKMEKGNYKYRLYETKKHYGHIVIPTGVGKSGVCIEDIIKNIEIQKSGVLIINISCPILKLTQQLMKDLFEVIQLRNINTDNIRFFINSSDDGGNYDVSSLDMDVNPLSQFETKHDRINIVASCNMSMWKFIKLTSKIRRASNDEKEKIKFKYRGAVRILNYIDEAHLLPIKEYTQTADGNDVDVDKRVDLQKLCENSEVVYAFTATPDPKIVEILYDYETEPMRGKRYIINTSAREAIQRGDILPPMVKFMRTKELNLTLEQLNHIMKDALESNPKIYHKILITAFSRPQLRELYEGLSKMGHKVFCICDPNGGYEDFEHSNITEFSNEIEHYQGNCFVIHIRMLREGIDIKGLTDCVLFSRGHGDQDKYRMTIQTIGRVLRCLKGERGSKFVGTKKKSYADSPRLKKYGGVYFISPSEDQITESNIRGLIERYYGLDCAVFEKHYELDKSGSGSNELVDTHSSGATGADEVDPSEENLNKLMMKVTTSIKERYGRLLSMKLPETKAVYKAIRSDVQKIVDIENSEYDTVDWLMNKEITNYVYKKIPSMFKSIVGFDINKFNEVL